MSLFTSLPQFEQSVLTELLKEDSGNVDAVKVARKSMEMRMSLYNKVFADLTTDHAKLLIGSTAIQDSFDKKFSSGLIYGEVTFASLVHIIQNTHPNNDEVFVDLGHGTGKALIATAAVFGDRLSHIYGIELLEPLHNEALRRIALYHAETHSNELFVHHRDCSITAVLGSFLDDSSSPDEFDWTKAGMLYTLLILLYGMPSNILFFLLIAFIRYCLCEFHLL
ncbi:hypothetical protein EON65_20130 [archaeon]|nr:MAG: hypothetical protein EON65_20130 [archaeon]